MSSDSPLEQHVTRNHGTDRTPVTVIGLGRMGRALAEAFLRDGHPTTVWNRTAAKAEPLVVGGATLAASVTDAVAAGPLVVVCITDSDAVRELLDPAGGLLDGRVLVNLSTGTSQAARATAEWAAGRGAAYLDGAIMGTPAAIGTADAFVLYNGSRPAFDEHEATLRSLGAGTAYLAEDPALSALHEMAVLSLMWNTMNGFLHGAALLTRAGVAATTFAPVAKAGIETVAGWVSGYARQIDSGAYPVDDITLGAHAVAMRHLIDESAAIGVSTELPRFLTSLADRAVNAGRGDDGYVAMIEQFRTPEEK
ncbi:NAD(P)-dependent oxidoreductase [Marinactinospora rubrisoli]|uniref:NAD(P)-dependent oxidoreductase n=1 Tax=Marinactinospora rubrisoli TaxID=2715399 RepID=A0ABW2KH58_9ACTN